ncbi:MAG: PIG-L family deacetylase [Candidatus Woesearchaeota archaeon]|nr:MAG: PIG-L family deacetylase [Candidatus Woesearchaeota archaeon]
MDENRFFSLPTTILAIVAHPDDEVSGMGGLLIKNSQLGGTNHIICYGGYEPHRATEFSKAVAILTAKGKLLKRKEGHYIVNEREEVDKLKEAIRKIKPTIIITHRPTKEYHLDHQDVSRVTRKAAVAAQVGKSGWLVKGILYPETQILLETIHLFIQIDTAYETLVKAFQAHTSQLEKNDSYYVKSLDARTKLRGVQAGCKRAEAFQFDPIELTCTPHYTNQEAKK